MHNFGFALHGAMQVLLVGLALGAGLPMLFAVGIRAMAYASPEGGLSADGRTYPFTKVLGWLCFTLVVLGVALGITFIVASGFGKEMSFEHIYPTLVDKH